MQDTAIVILNYNGAHFLRQFLPGVLTHADGARVVVADNASTDDSRALLAREFGAVEVLKFTENLGFCEGYNQALARLEAEFFVLLNSDVAVRPGWLPPLLRVLQAHPSAAAAQPKILAHANPTLFEYAGAGGGYLDALAYPFCRGRLFDTLEADHGQYDDARPVAWASGACCLVRASAWRALGGFEPAFFAHMEEIDFCWRVPHLVARVLGAPAEGDFAHMEEIDFCWRAQNAGYEVWYAGGASVVEHVGGGTLAQGNPRKTYLNFHNGLALLFKNAAPGELAPALILRLLLDWAAGLRLLAAGNWPEARAVGRAHLHFWRRLGYWRRRRRLAAPRLLVAERAGTYAGSVVWAYFGRGKKLFSQLSIDKANRTASL